MQRLTCSLRELKCASGENDADRMTFAGYGAVFGNVDADGDLILPGAFQRARPGPSGPGVLARHAPAAPAAAGLMRGTSRPSASGRT